MMSLLVLVNFAAIANNVFQSVSQMIHRKNEAKTNKAPNSKKVKQLKSSSSDKKVGVVPNFNGIEEIEELEEYQEESRNS